MGFIVFEEEAFNYLDAQFENFVKRMDRIRECSEDKTINKWLDTQDVCQTLNICPRMASTCHYFLSFSLLAMSLSMSFEIFCSVTCA